MKTTLIALMFCLSGMASAAEITWKKPGTTTGEESIDIASGRFVHAGYFGSIDHGTVNVSVGDRTIPFHKAGDLKSGHKAWINHLYQEGDHYRGEGSAEFQKVMDGVTHDTGLEPILTLGRLHVGATCQIQLFAVDERLDRVKDDLMRLSDNRANSSDEFTMGSRSYVMGTFSADATIQNITVAGRSWVINCYVLSVLDLGPDAKALEQIEKRKATARSWQRHETPSPVWVITPRVENGKQTGLYLGCQNNRVYSRSNTGQIEWSFDTGGLPSQIVSCDVNEDGAPEVLVASHDSTGTLYLLSSSGEVLKTYVNGSPFSEIAVADGKNGKVICGGAYDCSVVFLDKDLKLQNKADVRQGNLRNPVQALKAEDVTGDGEDNIVGLSTKGDIHVFRTDGSRLAYHRVTFAWFMGDLFLPDLNRDGRKEIFIISGSGGKSCGALQYQEGNKGEKLVRLWNTGKLLTSPGITIVDDFLPTKGLEVLNFDTDYEVCMMNSGSLDARGLPSATAPRLPNLAHNQSR